MGNRILASQLSCERDFLHMFTSNKEGTATKFCNVKKFVRNFLVLLYITYEAKENPTKK